MPQDSRPTLLVLGALSYLAAMLLHEAVGHGLFCLAGHGQPLVTMTATQCSGSALAMVLAGPGLNILAGVTGLLVLPRLERSSALIRWSAWLFVACNLFIAGGYMIVGGAANFGDWSALSAEIHPSWLARVIEVVVGASLYFCSIRQLARSLPTTDAARLRRLTRFPYLGAGVVAVIAGLINPIGVIPSLILPALSSFGGLIGIVLSDVAHDKVATEMPSITMSTSGLAIGCLAIALLAVIFGHGIRF